MTRDHIANEALASIQHYQRCGLGLTMGGGKTHIALRRLREVFQPGDRFLIVAPNLSDFDTWKQEAIKFQLEYLLPSLEFSTYLSLEKCPFTFKVVVLDECHSLLSGHDEWLSRYPGLILGLTGSPPRNPSSEKGKMVQKHCPIVYTYLTDEAVNHGILNDYRILVHHLPLSNSRVIKKVNRRTGGQWYQSEAQEYQYWTAQVQITELDINNLKGNIAPVIEEGGLSTKSIVVRGPDDVVMSKAREKREKAMIGLVNALKTFPTKVNYSRTLLRCLHEKVLVFANTKEQADSICVHSYHHGNPDSEVNLEKFKRGEISQLASILQLAQGKNIPGLREAVILHSYANERKASQRFGRLFRLVPEDVCLLHVLCYDETIDATWVEEAFGGFKAQKIFHYFPGQNRIEDFSGVTVPALILPWGEYTPARLSGRF